MRWRRYPNGTSVGANELNEKAPRKPGLLVSCVTLGGPSAFHLRRQLIHLQARLLVAFIRLSVAHLSHHMLELRAITAGRALLKVVNRHVSLVAIRTIDLD